MPSCERWERASGSHQVRCGNSTVAGAQTVRRAEAWVLKLALGTWNGDRPLAIVKDAAYTKNGVEATGRYKFRKEENWGL